MHVPRLSDNASQPLEIIESGIKRGRRQLSRSKIKCHICKEEFRNYELLNMHAILHRPIDRVPPTGPGKKPGYMCSLCNQTFSAGYALKKHIRVHSRERPFSCDLCGERFSQWGNLRLHWQRHLSVNPYRCPYCKKAYIAPSKLEVHIRSHTNDRPFNCDICTANFKSNDDLRKHMMIHADYRPFSCWVCDKSFMQPSKLRAHMRDKHDIPVAVVKTDVTDEGVEYRIKICDDYIQQSKISMFDDLSTFHSVRILSAKTMYQVSKKRQGQ